MNPHNWSSVRFYSSGDDYFSHIAEEIRQSQVRIRVESYIFTLDPLTLSLIDELAKARQRGVIVEILVDGFGSYYWIPQLKKICQQWNLDFRAYHALPSELKIFGSLLHTFTTRLPFLIKKFNRRNHRKLVLIDDRVAFVGSFNWTQVHSKKYFGSGAWKDFAVSLTGRELVYFIRAFRNTWNTSKNANFLKRLIKKKFDKNYYPEKILARLNTSRKMRRRLFADLLRRIKSAENQILISSAYFLPRPRLLRALYKAAQRGVKVEIIIPGPSDVPAVKWAAERVTHKLVKEGVKIYEYQKTILHSKFYCIDNKFAAVGSSNFNHRSLLHDLELEAAFTHPDHIQRIVDEFEFEKSNSQIISLQTLNNRPLWLRLISRIAYKLRYLL